MTCYIGGCHCYGGAVNGAVGHGRDSKNVWGTSFPWSRSYIRTPTKVGTVCASSASTGLCGGCRVTGIPTATSRLSRRRRARPPKRLFLLQSRDFSHEPRGRLEGGCSQDWLPHVEVTRQIPKSCKHPQRGDIPGAFSHHDNFDGSTTSRSGRPSPFQSITRASTTPSVRPTSY